MITEFLLLMSCELLGEIVRNAFNLPIPGPVIGMFWLAGFLAVRKDKPDAPAIPEALSQTADTLIGHMGLLFIPAGVGGKLTSTISCPIQIEGVVKVPARRAPELGEHNEEVLKELGFNLGDLERLRATEDV